MVKTIAGRGGSAAKENDTTLTPLSFLTKLGSFDTDPCGFEGHATAANVICLPEDGLAAKWIGRVWLNPPYTNPTPWLCKLNAHGDGIAMVLASTDARWYHDIVIPGADGLMFIKSRPKFQRPCGKLLTLVRASMLVAWGKHNLVQIRESGIAGHIVSLGSDKSFRLVA